MRFTGLLTIAAVAGFAAAAYSQEPDQTRSREEVRDQEQVQATTQEATQDETGAQAREQVQAQEQVNEQVRSQEEVATRGRGYVDADGDGICDNLQARARDGQGRGARAGRRGNGPGDGTGNQGVGPRDGSGYGPGGQSGNCDGTGPKGRRNRGNR